MSEKYLLVAPKMPVPYPVAVSGSRGIPGGGLRLGTLDNGKGNSDHLLRFEKGVVCAALPVASVASLRKAHPAHPAAANVIDQQVVEADYVVSAMGD